MVYFIGNKEKQLVKIGKANQPKRRIEEIQVGFPYQLEIFLIIEGNEAIEKTLHNKFKNKHIRGEWFILDEDILSFIDNPQIEINTIYQDSLDHMVRYSKETENKIELLYSKSMSNIEIANQLNINISKVRKIIKQRKLASKYRIYKEYKNKLTSQYNKDRNIRKKYRELYRKSLITKEQLDNILLQYPTKDKRGRKPNE